MELRPYQAEAKAAVFEQWDKGTLKTLFGTADRLRKDYRVCKSRRRLCASRIQGTDPGAPGRAPGTGCG